MGNETPKMGDLSWTSTSAAGIGPKWSRTSSVKHQIIFLAIFVLDWMSSSGKLQGNHNGTPKMGHCMLILTSAFWITPNGKCPNFRCHSMSSCLAVRFEGKVEGICNLGIVWMFVFDESGPGCQTGLQITGSLFCVLCFGVCKHNFV